MHEKHLNPFQKLRSMRLFILFSFIALMLLEAYGFTDETDRQALLEFKSHVSEGKQGVLSTWNKSNPVCNWNGVTCDHKHKRVISLGLSGLELSGMISPSIGNLSFLIALDLSNNTFGGTIPHEVGNLFRLRYLNMAYNVLEGGIPISLFNCSGLLSLYLGKNHLGQGVPSELGLLTKLEDLHLASNNLKGKLPASLGNLTSLMRVSFSDNSLQGEVPGDIARLTQMVFLILDMNKFSGVFPPAIYNFSSLERLYINDNHFSGYLRPDLGELLPNLQRLNIGRNYFKGGIPETLSDISNLQYLGLDENNLTGSIPVSFGKLRNLEILSLQDNSFGSHSLGDVEFLGALTNCTRLGKINVSGNRLGGHLPNSIANMSRTLQDFAIATNFISGSIPHGIGDLITLRLLALEENQLTGQLPTSIAKLLQLEGLYLNSNRISGAIPSVIGNLTRLNLLYLFNNSFDGTIPPSLGNCSSLGEVGIGFNKLDGTIPREIMKIHSLVLLDMRHNNLSGSIPEDIGGLTNLVRLSVAHNKLSGQIPQSLANCLPMEILWLQANNFDGAIPDIRRLVGLREVDFSNNHLFGSIPAYLANFSSLEYLNLSVNNFEGGVPTQGKFQNTSIVSLYGNKNLCGGIKEFKLKPCVDEAPSIGSKSSSPIKKIVIWVSIGIALSLLMVLAYVCLKKRNKNQQINNLTPSSAMEVFHERMSYGEIRNATDGFSSSNVIGSGSFGTVFKASLPAENKVVAIKVLNMQRHGAMKRFMAECESLKEVKHRNLVKLVTTCSSIDYQGNEFRALIYEFMPNGSLDMWLHPEEVVEEIRRPSRTLTLLERLNISIDVASVLDYLHVHCYEPIAHCDIKPSNVLLDDDLSAHVSDFGLARHLLTFDQESFFHQLSSAGVRGTIGYAAPEYGVGGQPTIHGDVYSFGVLLLEMFTGKRPTDELFEGNFTLHNYIKSVLPEKVLDIADKVIFLNGLRVGFPIAECLTQVLEVGLRCCEESPTNRIEASEATKELISIRERFFKTRRAARH